MITIATNTNTNTDTDPSMEATQLAKHVDDCVESITCYHCPVCSYTAKTKAAIARHINRADSVEHDVYRKKIEKLEDVYGMVDSLQELKLLGCDGQKCYDCGYTLCARSEKRIYNKNYKRLTRRTKSSDPNSAMNLLNNFYEDRGGWSPNEKREIKKLEFLIREYGSDLIRKTLKLLVQRGDKDITFLGHSFIKEVSTYYGVVYTQLKKEDTIPWLIKQYYINLNLFVSTYMVIQDYKRLEQIEFAHKLDVDQIKFAICYMINHKLIPLSSINHHLTKILISYDRHNQSNESQINYSQSIKDLLKTVDVTYDELINIYGDQQETFIKYIEGIIKQNEYSQNFSAIEWLYKLQFPLTKDIYFLAKNNVIQKNEKLYHFGNDDEINKFKRWLKENKMKYEN